MLIMLGWYAFPQPAYVAVGQVADFPPSTTPYPIL